MEEKNTLLMSFFDSSENFTLGFEAGQIWTKVEVGETLVNYMFHRKNKKQIKEIMKTFLSDFEIENINEEWCYLNMKKIEI